MASKNGDFKDWRIVRVEDVTTSFSGGTPSRGKSHLFGGSIPWLKSGEINSRVIRTTEETLSEEGLAESAAKWAKAGTVVGAMYGATAGTFGWLDIDTTVNQAVLVIDGKKDEADNRFLLHALTESAEQLLQTVQGSGQPNLNSDLIRKLKLLLPPLSSQKKIASILDSIDEAIEATRAVIDQTRRLKTALLQDLLTNGLPGRHKKFKEVKQVGRIPADWKVSPLADLISRDRPVCYGILMPGRGYSGGVPVIKVKDLVDGKINEAELLLTDPALDEEYRRSRLQTGDLLLSIRGTTGRVALVPESLNNANITQDTARLSIDGSVAADYLYYCLQGSALQDQIQHNTIGQAVKGINIEEVRKLSIPLPSEQEMASIVDLFHRVEHRINAELNYLEQLVLQKSALSQGLLTGRIPVKGAE